MENHRSFPDAADGRPMPPMGYELCAAGMSWEDAAFVARMLRQNGYYLVRARDHAAAFPSESAYGHCTWHDSHKADNGSLAAEVDRLKDERDRWIESCTTLEQVNADLRNDKAAQEPVACVERVARAWASIDGKEVDFAVCKEDPEMEDVMGHYECYMIAAEELLKRANIKTEAEIRADERERCAGIAECADSLELAEHGTTKIAAAIRGEK